jgi:hypothetical protein
MDPSRRISIPLASIAVLLLFSSGVFLDGERLQAATAAGAPAGGRIRFAGARSSAYGIRPFPTAEGWGKAVRTMSGYFPGSDPIGIWIVGRLHGASTGISLEFPHPSDGRDYGPLFTFAEADKHEPYLNYFDDNGIKVFLQIEPGFAEVETCIDLVLTQYKHHPCVLGWGIDVEWFKNAKTGSDNAVATDDLVKAWDAKVKSHNPKYRIFVKHFRTADLPPTYRGDVVFVNDSQQFAGVDSFLNEFKEFADFFYPNTVIYQIGYRADKKWWGALEAPIPKTLGEKLAASTRQECGIVWVDFSLRDVLPID